MYFPARDNGEYLIRGDLLIEQGVPGQLANQQRVWAPYFRGRDSESLASLIGLILDAGVIDYSK
jgi:hypothetical protein